MSGTGEAKTLIVVRHGNTFEKGETPRRVGAGTDIPLVAKGREQASAVATFMARENLRPDRVFAAPLRRTAESAAIIARGLDIAAPVLPAGEFTEIDYGPDENKTEEETAERIGRALLAADGEGGATPETAIERGKAAIARWDASGVVPSGWNVDVVKIIRDWRAFADGIRPGETVLLVSSNGIIRFAPHLLTEGYEAFSNRQPIKVSTGGVCVFRDAGSGWECRLWNARP